MRRASADSRLTRTQLALAHLLIVGAVFVVWYALTTPGLVSEAYANKIAFFFGRPLQVIRVVFDWFTSGKIYPHLAITLWETLLAFAAGSVLGLAVGLWLALAPTASAIAEPYITAMNAMPRVILAPIFAVWFGLGVLSKVALGVTLVFFIVFFNVYQGVKEVSPVVLANARMLGASRRQLLRSIYLPSATSWVFSSLHTSVGMAFVGAVVGEYLGSAKGVGYLILQAEGVFDINTVIAGIAVLTMFALLLDTLVTRIEARLLVWRPRTAETERLSASALLVLPELAPARLADVDAELGGRRLDALPRGVALVVGDALDLVEARDGVAHVARVLERLLSLLLEGELALGDVLAIVGVELGHVSLLKGCATARPAGAGPGAHSAQTAGGAPGVPPAPTK
jgi:NitT/TauT family transport system permease protein